MLPITKIICPTDCGSPAGPALNKTLELASAQPGRFNGKRK
jgi:hypothetical protein